mgnify:CR=1 FL=1
MKKVIFTFILLLIFLYLYSMYENKNIQTQIEKNVISNQNEIYTSDDNMIHLPSNEIINSLTQEDFIWFLVASSPSWKVWQMKKNPKTNELLQRNVNWENIEKFLQIRIDEINDVQLQKDLLEFKQIIKEYK